MLKEEESRPCHSREDDWEVDGLFAETLQGQESQPHVAQKKGQPVAVFKWREERDSSHSESWKMVTSAQKKGVSP